jgi:hypothetical protein
MSETGPTFSIIVSISFGSLLTTINTILIITRAFPTTREMEVDIVRPRMSPENTSLPMNVLVDQLLMKEMEAANAEMEVSLRRTRTMERL